MEENNLRSAQLLQLKIAMEIKRICEKHEIAYFMVAGTLLGAVRHHGFIPWDDDLDIGMLRPDYERFLHVCQEELAPCFFLQDWNTDRHYGLPFAKIRLNHTHYVERNAAKVQAHDGIYVDVFPFDNVPSDPQLQKKQDKETYLLKRLILVKNGYESWEEEETGKKLVYKLANILSMPISLKFLQNRLLRAMLRYNSEETPKVVTFGGSYGYQKETIERAWVRECTQLPFEETFFSAPMRYKEYLGYFYGDYMQLPPEDKRGDRHHIQKVDFGEYEA